MSSPATHRLGVGHDSARSTRPGSTVATFHVLAGLVGLVDQMTFPSRSSMPTQSSSEGHSMCRIGLARPSLWIVQADGPPVGLVEVTTLPASSVAAQIVNRKDEQETLVNSLMKSEVLLSRSTGVQTPPPGLVEVKSSPDSPVRTHNEDVSHETCEDVLTPPGGS